MRQAKEQGRNTFKFFSPSTHEQMLSYRRLETDLKVAVGQQQFELTYQPQLRLADHRIEAVEAQLVWNHPERGALSASEFASVAEESGQIVPLGLWMIEQVCRQLGAWEKEGVPVPRVTIRVTAAQLRQPDFHDAVRSVLASHSTDPELIELEFTERSLLDDTERTRERLFALRDVGVRLAVDDFGAGGSRLGYLRQLPLDVLRIDGSLVSDLATSEDARVVCSAILSMAHLFLLGTAAKGIESEQQEAFLVKHHCLYGQGNHFGAPMKADALRAMLIERGGQATRRPRVTRKRVAMKAGGAV
jgi:EAL domain-containing protein (putative c-di-GMP-specific phosphodiesterase class I)